MKGSERQSLHERKVEPKPKEQVPFKIVTIPPRPNSRKIPDKKVSPSQRKTISTNKEVGLPPSNSVGKTIS